MQIINLLAGPGTGKSTTAAGIFYQLKRRGIRVELVTEYIKSAVYEKRKIFDDQLYIFAKQNRRQFILKNQCDWIVTDSPILLSAVYAQANYFPSFKNLVLEAYDSYNNHNFFLQREKEYVNLGRNQTKKEAVAIDERVLEFLHDSFLPYTKIVGDENAVDNILDELGL